MLTNIIEVQNRNLKQWIEIARQIQLVSGHKVINERLARSDGKDLYDMYNLINVK